MKSLASVSAQSEAKEYFNMIKIHHTSERRKRVTKTILLTMDRRFTKWRGFQIDKNGYVIRHWEAVRHA